MRRRNEKQGSRGGRGRKDLFPCFPCLPCSPAPLPLHLFSPLILLLCLYQGESLALTGSTWLFTVPTAQTLDEGEFTVGVIYADIGFRNDVEVGIHGIKLKFGAEKEGKSGKSSTAIGASLLNFAYMVTSRKSDNVNVHIGFKSQPYFFFVGADIRLSNKDRLIVEANNGIGIGIRRRLKFHWMAEVGVAYSTFGLYRASFYRAIFEEPFKVRRSDFKLSPILGIYYSDVF